MVDLASRTVTKKIPVVKGAERIVVVGNEAFVGSTSDGNVLTNALTVINTDTDEIKQPEITVGVNPNPLAVDANGRLWAYASTTKEMVRINPASKLVETRVKLGVDADKVDPFRFLSSFALSADKQAFYFVNSYYNAAGKETGETYRFGVNSTAETLFIRRIFSGLGVDPTGVLYAGVTPSYKQAGYVLRYQPGTTTGTLIDSVKVEMRRPGSFFGKYARNLYHLLHFQSRLFEVQFVENSPEYFVVVSALPTQGGHPVAFDADNFVLNTLGLAHFGFVDSAAPAILPQAAPGRCASRIYASVPPAPHPKQSR